MLLLFILLVLAVEISSISIPYVNPSDGYEFRTFEMCVFQGTPLIRPIRVSTYPDMEPTTLLSNVHAECAFRCDSEKWCIGYEVKKRTDWFTCELETEPYILNRHRPEWYDIMSALAGDHTTSLTIIVKRETLFFEWEPSLFITPPARPYVFLFTEYRYNVFGEHHTCAERTLPGVVGSDDLLSINRRDIAGIVVGVLGFIFWARILVG